MIIFCDYYWVWMSGFFALFWERYIAWFTQRDVQRLVLGYEVVLLKGLVWVLSPEYIMYVWYAESWTSTLWISICLCKLLENYFSTHFNSFVGALTVHRLLLRENSSNNTECYNSLWTHHVIFYFDRHLEAIFTKQSCRQSRNANKSSKVPLWRLQSSFHKHCVVLKWSILTGQLSFCLRTNWLELCAHYWERILCNALVILIVDS